MLGAGTREPNGSLGSWVSTPLGTGFLKALQEGETHAEQGMGKRARPC